MIEIKGNSVLRDGEVIGTILDGVCYSPEKLAPVIKKQIKQADGNESLKFEVVADDPPPPTPTETAPAGVGSPDTPANGLERLLALANEGKIPQPPAKHPAMGDKTPDFVAWFKAHATAEEIAVRYPAHRRLPASMTTYEEGEAKRLPKRLPGEVTDTET